ncbi:MAG: DMT family transporter [Flavobacteriales bacterium]|nr:DMT family transporter [Flavobacteriales bacterium]
METNRRKGYLFAILSTLAMSNVYIFSKAALKEVSLPQFGFYWFGVALILLITVIIIRKDYKVLKTLDGKAFRVLLTIGVIDIFSTSLFFLTIKTIDNPAIVSFLGNMKPIFVISLGFLILNERFKGIEIVGLVITLIGGLILGYRPNLSFQMLYDGGIIFILGSMILGAGSMIFIRKNPLKVPSIIYATSRSILLMLASLIYLFFSGHDLSIPQSALINISLGSVLGPFLAVMASYTAIRNLEASRVSLIGTAKGVFVLIGAYFAFGEFPTSIQIIGGITTISGVIMITLGKKMKVRSSKSKE